MRHVFAAVVCAAAIGAAGCSSDSSGMSQKTATVSSAVDAQRPPTTGYADVEAWLDKGDYMQWHCESVPHDARSPSPHGINRICSNDAASTHGDGEYPVDAAAVKELYDSDGKNVVGYAVYRHVSAGKTGSSWYWYERVPAESKVPHDTNGVVADGVGGKGGPPDDICVSCHSAAGSDSAHFGHDFVYTQVM